MITLPLWLLALVAALIAIAMYFLGGLNKTVRGHRASYEAGRYQGYYHGYADCKARARSCMQAEQTTKSEVAP
jgi:hypothetical protein